MSQYNTSGEKAYIATSALGDGVIVKLSSGQVVAATAGTDLIVGVTVGAVGAGEVANVRLRSAQGTIKIKAGGTIAVGDAITATTAGAGIATTTATHKVVGVALEAASSGDIFEAMTSTNVL